MNDTDEKYLIRITDGTFLVDVDATVVVTTAIPSRALHANYLTCDQWVQRFKRRGYPESVVCDHLGRPVTYEQLLGTIARGKDNA